MKKRVNEWVRLGHRGLVLLRAFAGESFEQIEADHQTELGRADRLINSLKRVAGVSGDPPPKKKPAAAHQRRETH